MNTSNKNLILNNINASGVIDKIGYILQGSGLCDGFQNTSWTNVNGTLTSTVDVDFTNNTGSAITIVGVALFSSNLTEYDGNQILSSYAVNTDIYDIPVTLNDGEILRVSYTFTIDD